MVKVMYLLHYVGDGGSEKYVFDLMSAMDPKDCLLVYSMPGPFLDKFKSLHIPIYQINMKNPFDLRAAKQIKEIARKERATIIHAQFLRENYIAILTKLLGARVEVIWTYHVDVEMPFHLQCSNALFTRQNNTVICVSNFMKDQILKKGVPLNKIKVIYNGVMDPLTDQIPVMYGTGHFAVIGRISEEKGHLFLLQSLKRLVQINPGLDWHCNIIGTGPLQNKIKADVKDLSLESRITFKGFQDNVIKEYAQNDFVVIPSENESLSYVAIEALAMKKPVIATNVGGLPEVIKPNQTGLLVSYGDAEGLAKTIQLFLNDASLCRTLGEHGRQAYLQTFSFAAMIKETFRIYQNCRG
jgi:L-malate glycosyltransferase